MAQASSSTAAVGGSRSTEDLYALYKQLLQIERDLNIKVRGAPEVEVPPLPLSPGKQAKLEKEYPLLLSKLLSAVGAEWNRLRNDWNLEPNRFFHLTLLQAQHEFLCVRLEILKSDEPLKAWQAVGEKIRLFSQEWVASGDLPERPLETVITTIKQIGDVLRRVQTEKDALELMIKQLEQPVERSLTQSMVRANYDRVKKLVDTIPQKQKELYAALPRAKWCATDEMLLELLSFGEIVMFHDSLLSSSQMGMPLLDFVLGEGMGYVAIMLSTRVLIGRCEELIGLFESQTTTLQEGLRLANDGNHLQAAEKIKQVGPQIFSDIPYTQVDGPISQCYGVINDLKQQIESNKKQVLARFARYSIFSGKFWREIPNLPMRPKVVQAAVNAIDSMLSQERQKTTAMKPSELQTALGEILDREADGTSMVQLAGTRWVIEGWINGGLIAVALLSCLALGGSQALVPIQKMVRMISWVMQQGSGEHDKAPEPEYGYVALQCKAFRPDAIRALKLFDAQGCQWADFVKDRSLASAPSLVRVPVGDYGVLIETRKTPIVGTISISKNQHKIMDLSAWSFSASHAPVALHVLPADQVVQWNGAPVTTGNVRIVLGAYRVVLDRPGFPRTESLIEIHDCEPQTLTVKVPLGKVVFQCNSTSQPERDEFTTGVAALEIDGQRVASPPSDHILPVGQHLVGIFYKGGLLRHYGIHLSEGQEIVIAVMSDKELVYKMSMTSSSVSTGPGGLKLKEIKH